MTVTVGTNSYGDETGLNEYASLRGITISGDATELLIKAMDWLEIQPFSGSKYLWSQALEFPRNNPCFRCGDIYGEVPDDIIKAQYVAALLIDSGEDLNPIIGRQVKKETVDVISVEYQDLADERSKYPQLQYMLSRFIANTGGSFGVYR